MADLPITFSGPMVRAILREIEKPGTGKTQTRRVLMKTRNGTPVEMYPSGDASRPPFNDPDQWGFPYYDRSADSTEIMRLPDYAKSRIRPGDRLYVREHWRTVRHLDGYAPRDLISGDGLPIEFIADDRQASQLYGRFRQAMHMPKWASRITLIVTDVRVERLQDCSEEDAIAEGIQRSHHGNGDEWLNYPEGSSAPGWMDPRKSYRTLWDSINGEGAWAKNPWVTAYTFRPVLGNIDQIGEAA